MKHDKLSCSITLRQPPLPPIGNLMAFQSVAELGRFKRAAGQLGLTESAISHQIRKLELQLGVSLIDRRHDGAILTAAGVRFQAKIAPALRLITDGVEELVGHSQAKVLLTLPRSLAVLWLVPRLASFYRANEDVEVQLLPTERLCDLQRERIDLGIRTGNGVWPGLNTRYLFDDLAFPVATPEYARRVEHLGWADLCATGRIIVNALHPDEWQVWCEREQLPVPAKHQSTTLNSFDLVLNAALSGMGLAMGRRPMVDDLLRSSSLVAPFGTDGIKSASYFAVWPAGQPLSRQTRVVLEWLHHITCD